MEILGCCFQASNFQTGFWTPERPWVISKGPAKEKQSLYFVNLTLLFQSMALGGTEAKGDGTVSGEADSLVPLTLKSELQLPEQALLHKVPEM